MGPLLRHRRRRPRGRPAARGEGPILVRCQYLYRTPIYFAVRENRLDIASFLLERGADPLSLAVDDSLLEICRDRGHAEMERLLETHHARVQNASPRGEAVAAAIRERDLTKVRGLLDRGPDLLHARDEHCRSTPLGWAAKSGRIAAVELLLRRGARPRLPDDPPWAVPLEWAVRRGHREVADLLKAAEGGSTGS